MARVTVSQILKQISESTDKKNKIDLLRRNKENSAMIEVLRHALDPRIEFLLPEGEPPYNESKFDEDRFRLYNQVRKFYLFVKGGNDNIHPIKRERIFIELLETIDPEDAKLVMAMKDKRLPYKGINLKLVQEAFPGLINV
jgi:hypothetical protein